jgi:carboxymethylenebutenolidase
MAGVRDGQEPNFPHLTTKPHCVADNVTLQTPLSRRGIGPGLLVLVPSAYCGTSSGTSSKTLDPEPLQKWAEEGFAVIQVKVADIDTAKKECAIGIKALQELPQCSSFHQIGVVGRLPFHPNMRGPDCSINR